MEGGPHGGSFTSCTQRSGRTDSRSTKVLSSNKKALLEHFLPPEARRMYYTYLYNRKQGGREPVEDFARAIQDLTRRAHLTMAATEQELLCREHFLHGLRPQLKRLVLVSNPQTFTDAISVVKREEYNDHIVSGSAPWLKPNSDNFYQQTFQPQAALNNQDSEVDVVVYGRPGACLPERMRMVSFSNK